MAITFVNASTIVEANTTVITLDTATITDLQDDDVMLFCVCEDDNIALSSNDGLTDIGSGSAGNREMHVWRKVAATEGGTYGFQNSTPSAKNYSGVILAFRGVDTTTPEDATPTNDQPPNDETPAAVAITTATANAWVVTFLGSVNAGTTEHTGNQPTGYTLRATVAADGDRNLGAADIDAGAAGVEDPGDWGDSGYSATTDHVSITVALKPAGDISIAAGVDALTITANQASIGYAAGGSGAEHMLHGANLGTALIGGGGMMS